MSKTTKAAEVVSIETPKKFILNGLWFGPEKAKRAFIFIHGLGSIVFAHHEYLLPLVDKNTAALFFNNRGHSIISGIRRKAGGKYKKILAGMALEKFTDCADDIEGAIRLAERKGAKEIYLVGHSTGSQKVAYYLSKKQDRRHVLGGVLMAPISDHAGIKTSVPPGRLKQVLTEAELLIRRKKPEALLPRDMWEVPVSAQRFVSLYKGEGPEEIFTYWTDRRPATLLKVRKPLLVVLAERDEHSDRPVKELVGWFAKHLKTGDAISVIRGANHGFRKKEERVARDIALWSTGL